MANIIHLQSRWIPPLDQPFSANRGAASETGEVEITDCEPSNGFLFIYSNYPAQFRLLPGLDKAVSSA